MQSMLLSAVSRRGGKMAYPSTWSRKGSYCTARLWKSGLKQTKTGLRYKEKYVILLSLVANRVQMLQCLTQFIQDFFSFFTLEHRGFY